MTKKALILAGVLAVLSGCANKPADTSSKREDIRLIQSTRGAAIAIQDQLLFASGSATLRAGADEVMGKVAEILKAKAKSQVLIEGHTDNVGSIALNQKLSEDRASAVRQALISRGIDGRRMAAKGYGFTEPLESNATPEGRQANRRAEVVFPGETIESLTKDTEEQFSFSRVFNDALKSLKSAF